MKKIIALILACVCMLSLCACGGEKQDENTQVELDLAALSTSMQEKIGVTMPELNQNMALNLYGLTTEDCAEMVILSDYDATKCNEVWLIKASGEEALGTVKELAQNRVDALIAQSNNYNADVYAASNDARIETRGLYLLLVVTTAGDSGEVAQLFLNA